MLIYRRNLLYAWILLLYVMYDLLVRHGHYKYTLLAKPEPFDLLPVLSAGHNVVHCSSPFSVFIRTVSVCVNDRFVLMMLSYHMHGFFYSVRA